MKKNIIYQLLPRLFSNQNTTNKFAGTLAQNGCGKFNDINDVALKSIKDFGATHVWYTGVLENATQTVYDGLPADDPAVVKGVAGSPYAVKDYYDVNPDYAVNVKQRMKEFEDLINRTHRHNMKVIMDFVPNHVARGYRSDVRPKGIQDLGEGDDTNVAFSTKNNFYYIPGQPFKGPKGTTTLKENPAKVTGSGSTTASPDVNDWYETVKLNYGLDVFHGESKHFDPIPSTWNKMLDILLFWSQKGIDGFRCDMAQMVPPEFWKWAIQRVREKHPQMYFLAEIYEEHKYRDYISAGFDSLYDKNGMYDHLRKLMEGHGSAYDVRNVWQGLEGISSNMLRFLETHDEQRITSQFFATDAFTAVPSMLVTATLSDGPYLLYFGQEIGVEATEPEGFSGADGRTTIFDYWGLKDWQAFLNAGKYDTQKLSERQKSLRHFYSSLNHFVLGSEAVKSGKFWDLQYVNDNGQSEGYNAHRLYSYLRFSDNQKLLFVVNFSKEEEYNFVLKTGKDALQAMKFDAQSNVSLTQVFPTSSSQKLNGNLVEGIRTSLKPLSVVVYQLS
ncbi:alpha amylase [Planoprotostelium fungivorum]|uniref:Alpha amylase n=1 Tax=Planoprotostelium fungivorum TaxID=1890364 RepID=A0A2P6NWW9_9EUKA|nr:alpha amylase [Planoprotostelium fungivorum]